MLDIILNMLVVAITEELYPAIAADLSYTFAVHEKGLMIKISGFNEKLPVSNILNFFRIIQDVGNNTFSTNIVLCFS